MPKSLGNSFGGIGYFWTHRLIKAWSEFTASTKTKNKFGYAYLLTQSGISEKSLQTGSFLTWKLKEYEKFKSEINALNLKIEIDHDNNPSNTWAHY